MNKELEIQRLAHDIIREGFESAGIKDEEPFKVLAQGLRATKTIVIKAKDITEEDEQVEVPDLIIRHKYLLTALQVKRLLDNKIEEAKLATVTHKMDAEDITRLETIARELKGLETRLVNDKTQQGDIIDITTSVVLGR